MASENIPQPAQRNAQDDRQVASQIRLILSDVDGVMTGGELYYDSLGAGIKRFHVRDGMGIKVWQRAGFAFGIVSARHHAAVGMRANELGIEHVLQGVDPKLPAVNRLLRSLNLSFDQTAYVGDDLPDLPILRQVALAVAPADACADVKAAAHWVTSSRGGDGVLRELIERLMRATSMWETYALL